MYFKERTSGSATQYHQAGPGRPEGPRAAGNGGKPGLPLGEADHSPEEALHVIAFTP